jgi:hypothetical protein
MMTSGNSLKYGMVFALSLSACVLGGISYLIPTSQYEWMNNPTLSKPDADAILVIVLISCPATLFGLLGFVISLWKIHKPLIMVKLCIAAAVLIMLLICAYRLASALLLYTG